MLIRFLLVIPMMMFCLTSSASTKTNQLAEKQLIIEKIEKYLNDITTLTADFSQIDITGAESVGLLFIARPGKLRWQYLKPTPLLIVFNGSLITYYDQELKQASHASSSNNLFGFLAKKNIKLDDKDLLIKEVTNKAGVITIWLQQLATDKKETIKIIFNEAPIFIKKLEFLDEVGNITAISLTNLKRGMKLDHKLFTSNQLNELR